MKDLKSLFHEVVAAIHLRESEGEINSIASGLVGHFFNVSYADIITARKVVFTAVEEEILRSAINRINQGEPLQYVIGEADFYGRKFSVNSSVLIPRPETEELVSLVLDHVRLRGETPARVLDVGTGSGCIPITLFLELDAAQVYATDVSEAALKLAADNAARYGARIEFHTHDILTEKIPWKDLDVMVSNPPYVPERDKATMAPNVIDHEPHLALFVPDDDPLKFYAAICREAQESLVPDGLLAVEVHEKFGREVALLFEQKGFYDVRIVKDISGKERIVKGLRGKVV